MSENNVTPIKSKMRGRNVLLIEDHIFCRIIKTWAQTLPNVKEHLDNLNYFSWTGYTDRGIGFYVALYRLNEDEELFFWIESAPTLIHHSKKKSAYEWLLQMIHDIPYPFRIALDGEAIVIQYRNFCEGVTAEHFKLRLESLLPFSNWALDELSRRFDLKPPQNSELLIKK